MTDQQRIDAIGAAVKVLNDTLLEAPNDYLLKIDTNVSLLTDPIKTNGKWNCRAQHADVSFFKRVATSERSIPDKLIPVQKNPRECTTSTTLPGSHASFICRIGRLHTGRIVRDKRGGAQLS